MAQTRNRTGGPVQASSGPNWAALLVTVIVAVLLSAAIATFGFTTGVVWYSAAGLVAALVVYGLMKDDSPLKWGMYVIIGVILPISCALLFALVTGTTLTLF